MFDLGPFNKAEAWEQGGPPSRVGPGLRDFLRLGTFSGKTRKVPGELGQLVTLLGKDTSTGRNAHGPAQIPPGRSGLLSQS